MKSNFIVKANIRAKNTILFGKFIWWKDNTLMLEDAYYDDDKTMLLMTVSFDTSYINSLVPVTSEEFDKYKACVSKHQVETFKNTEMTFPDILEKTSKKESPEDIQKIELLTLTFYNKEEVLKNPVDNFQNDKMINKKSNSVLIKKTEIINKLEEKSFVFDVNNDLQEIKVKKDLSKVLNNKFEDKDNFAVIKIVELHEPVIEVEKKANFLQDDSIVVPQQFSSQSRLRQEYTIMEAKERSKKFNEDGFEYGKQHHIYLANRKKTSSSFSKSDICVNTGRYIPQHCNNSQVLYLKNSVEKKQQYRSQSRKKYKYL